jgi:hypothetical protein
MRFDICDDEEYICLSEYEALDYGHKKPGSRKIWGSRAAGEGSWQGCLLYAGNALL